MNYTLKLASRMQLFETDDDVPHILRHAYVVEEIDHKRIQQMSELLCDPSRVNIYLRSKSFEGQCDVEDAFYKTKYSREPFSERLL